MSRDISSVLCPRDVYFIPTITQLHAFAELFASIGIIEDSTRDELDTVFDELGVGNDGRINADKDIEIKYATKKMPWFGSGFEDLFFHKGGYDDPSFKIAERDEFERYYDFDDLHDALLADRSLAELELQLTKVFGTEIVSGMMVNGGFEPLEPRSDED